MSDNVDAILSMSQRVLRLREELAQAELQLQGLVRGTARRVGRPPSRTTSPAASTVALAMASEHGSKQPKLPPVSQRVAKALAQKGALTFGELFQTVQPAKRGAVKSALVVGREKGEYEYKGGKYQYKKKGPKGSSPRASASDGSAAT